MEDWQVGLMVFGGMGIILGLMAYVVIVGPGERRSAHTDDSDEKDDDGYADSVEQEARARGNLANTSDAFGYGFENQRAGPRRSHDYDEDEDGL